MDLELLPMPDLPEDRESPLSERFAAQLLIAAKPDIRTEAHERCVEWGRTLLIAEEERAERAVQYRVSVMNLEESCSRSKNTHDQRLAREAKRRLPALDDDTDAAVEEGPDDDGERAYLLFVDVHPSGTKVLLDGTGVCREPCLVAIPIDGRAHHLEFKRAGQSARIDWTPATIDDPGPELPALG
ncbi:MAG: hypothetical protein R3A51_11570 [Nannocystaceae bacterium]